jgi:hypothetical protein
VWKIRRQDKIGGTSDTGAVKPVAISQYFLSGTRIGFRRWTPDDFAIAKELWGDPDVTRLFSKEPLSDIQIRERLGAEMDSARTYGMQY